MNKSTVLSVLAFLFVLTGCLQTRTSQKEQEEKQVLKKQLSHLQQNTADINARFQDIDDELRRMNGRIEAVEARTQQQLAQVTAEISKNEKAQFESKLRERDEAYREEFTKLHNEIIRLREQVNALQEVQRRSQAVADSGNPFATAEELFNKKAWRDAILSYEKYRSQNPKGKFFATATYKIGVCFEELGMHEEAVAFYEEVIAKFPKSKDAKGASSRLKKLKSAAKK